MKPEISILFGHYSEDRERDAIALQCLQAVQQFRSPQVEVILTCNGECPYPLKELCDKWSDRPVDIQPGRTVNEGVKLASGDILFIMSNDVLLYPGAVEKSAEIVRVHKKLLSTCVYPKTRFWHEQPQVSGYNVNLRLGSNCLCMRRDQYEDIGPLDEVLINFDMINYINRWIRKGYAVAMTHEILGKDLGEGVHSYTNLQKETQFKKWNSRKTIYDPEMLKKISKSEF